MTDYLAPAGPMGRWFALILSFLATLISAAITSGMVAMMLEKGSLADKDGTRLWVAACFLGLLTLATGWMTVRLWSGASANGVTMMPLWFIEAFGSLMMSGMVGALFVGQWHVLVPGSVGIIMAMLLIRMQVRRRLRAQTEEIPGPEEGPAP